MAEKKAAFGGKQAKPFGSKEEKDEKPAKKAPAPKKKK
jgi:hypothetical protein